MNTRLISLAASSAAVIGLMGSGVVGATTAFAGSGTGNTCTNYKSLKLVECVGQVNVDKIDVKISALNDVELNILSGNNLVVLANALNDIEAVDNNNVELISADLKNVLSNLHINVCNIQVLDVTTGSTNTSTCTA
jgi:hypothetical protein